MLGVMVGVMAMVVVISVMNGFRSDLMSKILGINPHLEVVSRSGTVDDHGALIERCLRVGGVTAAAPFVQSQVMVNRGGNVAGAVMKGVEPASTSMVVPLSEAMREGSLESLDNGSGAGPPAVIGIELARLLGAGIGSRVTVVSPEGRLTPLGRVPNSRTFVVSGIFDSGMYEHDVSMFFVGLGESRDFLGIGGRVSGLHVRIENPGAAVRIAGRVAGELGEGFAVRDWISRNKSLFAALRLEKVTMFVILAMMVLVGALNIISTLVMVVMEKTGDLTIMRVMGATRRSVMGIFVIQGVLIGVFGTVCGIAAGLGLCRLLATAELVSLPVEMFYLRSVPVRVEMLDVWVVAASAFFLSFLATIYPSWRASKLNPAEAIRYG